ncbi:tRNA preQ1(34) S-adenosylmethionine ribosyltransferase-isomerase QueA [Helicobacter sp. MIT 05-5293]|uniref:tRNA preQ1(34) S-adenosylmethionine ribosyltransferase-isomerase QueA n=1 Tax=Helicobacter sp. MIT 05-5293 TaxID=1548149 RepID=UPI00051E01F4|nr:tRNA preQ1(34) S-adenosylmethionine ribosyltransferase-isomerase QueA [Helicobacter sp. MIT 05-5293]TLD80138.1 tRNA preQ1(34) S-adenosylmethionine ribosyltransferase-isomerase QueA [Helicobacter sp. MIT 05-5293]
MTKIDAQSQDFLLSSYDYDLPPQAIALYPTKPPENGKLLVYERDNDRIIHSDFAHFSDFVPDDTLLVFNDTKVIKARLYGYKINAQGHKKIIEIFYHKPYNHALTEFLIQTKGRIKKGDRIILESNLSESTQKGDSDETYVQILDSLDNGFRIARFIRGEEILNQSKVLKILENKGHIPLPPYIKRQDTAQDECDYQSVFAKNLGAVASPTASLHFSTQHLAKIQERFQTCFITLHVGAGTFVSVQTPDIRQHQIHSEFFDISPQVAHQLDKASKVLCIGTTCARSVEYYARHHLLQGECDLFLYPGEPFLRVDYLLSNFHLPKSTLIMLISAMIGRKKCLEIYHQALENGYRFYSYGDGMLIL